MTDAETEWFWLRVHREAQVMHGDDDAWEAWFDEWLVSEPMRALMKRAIEAAEYKLLYGEGTSENGPMAQLIEERK